MLVTSLEWRYCNASNVEFRLDLILRNLGWVGNYNYCRVFCNQSWITDRYSGTIFSFIHMAVDYDDTAIGVIWWGDIITQKKTDWWNVHAPPHPPTTFWLGSVRCVDARTDSGQAVHDQYAICLSFLVQMFSFASNSISKLSTKAELKKKTNV